MLLFNAAYFLPFLFTIKDRILFFGNFPAYTQNTISLFKKKDSA